MISLTDRRERWETVQFLRENGATFSAIGKVFNVSTAWAHKIYNSEFPRPFKSPPKTLPNKFPIIVDGKEITLMRRY